MVACYVNSLAQFYPNPSTIPTEFPEILLSQMNECKINPAVDPGQPQLYFTEPPVVSPKPSENKSMFENIKNLFNNDSTRNYLIILLVILVLVILLYKNRNKFNDMFSKNTASSYKFSSLTETVNKLN